MLAVLPLYGRVEWAASVPDRPMPIKLKLKGIFEYMEEDQGKVFMQAVLAKYGINLNTNQVLSDVLKASHFGVFTSNGIPISSYSGTALSNYRTLMTTNFPPPAALTTNAGDTSIVILEDESARYASEDDPVEWKDQGDCPTGQYVCGVKAHWDSCLQENPYYTSSYDDLGITMVSLICCTRNGDQAGGQSRNTVRLDVTYFECSRGVWSEAICPENSWTIGLQGRYHSYSTDAGSDPEGLNGLRMFCSNDRNKAVSVSEQGVTDKSRWGQRKYIPQGKLITGARVEADLNYYTMDNNLEADELGVTNIEVFFETVALSDSFAVSFYSYEAIWDGSTNVVSAFFATPIYGVVAKDPSEENRFNSMIHRDLWKSGIASPFGYMSTTDGSIARFGFRLYETTKFSDKNLESFSFLSADNLEKNPQITAGVIHPDGFALNKLFGFDEGFEVQGAVQIDARGNENIQIMFSRDETCNVNDIPTVAVFPILFSESGKLPNSVWEYRVFLRHEYWLGSEDAPACQGRTGESAMILGPSLGGNFGYSFLRIGRKINVKGLYHGYIDRTTITTCPVMKRDIPGLGYCQYGSTDRKHVLLQFDEPFEDVPSVIVTGVAPSNYADRVGDETAPFIVVSDISRYEARVYADFFANSSQKYGETMSFTVVVTGPPKLEAAKSSITTCPAYLPLQ